MQNEMILGIGNFFLQCALVRRTSNREDLARATQYVFVSMYLRMYVEVVWYYPYIESTAASRPSHHLRAENHLPKEESSSSSELHPRNMPMPAKLSTTSNIKFKKKKENYI
jgi:hypothetical protein